MVFKEGISSRVVIVITVEVKFIIVSRSAIIWIAKAQSHILILITQLSRLYSSNTTTSEVFNFHWHFLNFQFHAKLPLHFLLSVLRSALASYQRI